MKKIIIFIILLAIAGGIGAFLYFKPNGKNELVLSYYDNTSTGSYWQEKVDKEGIVEVSKKSDYSNCPTNSEKCSGHIIYTIKPIKAGNVQVTFEWLRYNGDVAKRAIYNIIVTNDLKITETHTESYYQ